MAGVALNSYIATQTQHLNGAAFFQSFIRIIALEKCDIFPIFVFKLISYAKYLFIRSSTTTLQPLRR